MSRKTTAPLLALGLAAALVAGVHTAQQTAGPIPAEKIDASLNARIREEGLQRSQIMRIEHYLTDVYGPRVTGSPNHVNAAKWAVSTMESWGMKNGALEPWDFGREGWLNERADGHIVSPVKANLVFAVQAWTPSTKGTVTAPAVNLVTPVGPEPPAAAGRGGAAPTRLGPTQAELDAYFTQMAPKVKGAIVLVGASRVPAFLEVEATKRRNDEQTQRQVQPRSQRAADRPRRQSRGRTSGRRARRRWTGSTGASEHTASQSAGVGISHG